MAGITFANENDVDEQTSSTRTTNISDENVVKVNYIITVFFVSLFLFPGKYCHSIFKHFS